jgi:hypothetical protein
MLNTRLQGDDPTPVAGVTKPAWYDNRVQWPRWAFSRLY